MKKIAIAANILSIVILGLFIFTSVTPGQVGIIGGVEGPTTVFVEEGNSFMSAIPYWIILLSLVSSTVLLIVKRKNKEAH